MRDSEAWTMPAATNDVVSSLRYTGIYPHNGNTRMTSRKILLQTAPQFTQSNGGYALQF
jgi:hypothetical protein